MGFHNQCGLTRADTTKCQYTPDGRLWETNKYGVYEVSSHAGLAPHPCCCPFTMTAYITLLLPFHYDSLQKVYHFFEF